MSLKTRIARLETVARRFEPVEIVIVEDPHFFDNPDGGKPRILGAEDWYSTNDDAAQDARVRVFLPDNGRDRDELG